MHIFSPFQLIWTLFWNEATGKQFDPFRSCFNLCRQDLERYDIVDYNYIKAHIVDVIKC